MAYPPASGAHLLFSTPYHHPDFSSGPYPGFIVSTPPPPPPPLAGGSRPRQRTVTRAGPTPPSHNYKTESLSFPSSYPSRPDTSVHSFHHNAIGPVCPSPAPSKTATTTTVSSSSSSTTPVTPLSLLGSWSSTHSSSSSMPSSSLMQVKDPDSRPQPQEAQGVAQAQHSFQFQSPHIGAMVSSDTEAGQGATQPLDLLSSVDSPWAPDPFSARVSVPSPSSTVDASGQSFGGHSRAATQISSGFAPYEGSNLDLSFEDNKSSIAHLSAQLNALGTSSEQAPQQKGVATSNDDIRGGQPNHTHAGEHVLDRPASFHELSAANQPWSHPQTATGPQSSHGQPPSSPAVSMRRGQPASVSSRSTVGVDRVKPSRMHGQNRALPYPARPPHRSQISASSSSPFVSEIESYQDRGDSAANSFSTANHSHSTNYSYSLPSGSSSGNQSYYTGTTAPLGYPHGGQDQSQSYVPGVGNHNHGYAYGDPTGSAPTLGHGYTYDNGGGPGGHEYQYAPGRSSGDSTDFSISTHAASQRRIMASSLPERNHWPHAMPFQPGAMTPRVPPHAAQSQSHTSYQPFLHSYAPQAQSGFEPQYANAHSGQPFGQSQSAQDGSRQAFASHDPASTMHSNMGSSSRSQQTSFVFYRRSSDQRLVSVSADAGSSGHLVQAPQTAFPPDLFPPHVLASVPSGPHPPGPIAARLECHTALMELAHSWDDDEYARKRRLVQFWRYQAGPTIHITARPISPSNYKSDNIVISCIYREDRNDCYITSVDTIALLEALIGLRFSIEEKNRIRRNLEGFRPLTVAKAKRETSAFFGLIMGFPDPKPRNIEKDVKVFPWSTLTDALKKIVSKYNVHMDGDQTLVASGELFSGRT